MSKYSHTHRVRALLAPIEHTVSPQTQRDYMCVSSLFTHIWQQSVPLCYFMETSVLCDQVSQASFIRLSNASLWFVLHFFTVGGEGGKIQGLSYSETVEREGGREGGRKTYWGWEREDDREREEKEGKTGKGRRSGGPAAPLLLPQYHLRGRKQPPARSFLIICSICADPTLFSLKITQRNALSFTPPALPPHGGAGISTCGQVYPPAHDILKFLILYQRRNTC